MARNRIVNKLKSRIPYLGNNQALKNHIANALRNAGDLSVVIRNIDAIPKENMDSLTKTGLEKFKTEIIPEIRQIIKETQGEAAEQGSKLEQAEAKQEVVKGEGWTMRDGGEAKQYAEHKFELEKWINDLSGVLSDEWIANLKSLALKHPEMFKSEADVFRVIKEIKDNPTHFFKNNNDRNALLVKNLKEGKSGEIAVRKTDGQIVHATINNEKRLDRLQKRNKENLGNGKLSKVEYSDGARRLPRHSDQSRTMPTAKAESAADDAGIIQTFARPGSKLENRGLGYQDETIISQNSAKDEEAIKTYVNPHVGAGLAGGTLNSVDENGNFDAEKFAKGFIYGLFGSKVTAATLKKTNPKLYDQIVNIGKDKADKESLSGRVDKIKMPDMGKFLQKLIADKNISDKTKTQMIEAAKGRYAQEIKNEQTKKAIEASAQKGRDMTPIGRENLNAEIVEYLTNNRQNVAIDILSPKIAQKLGFRYANVKRTISGDAVRHTINRHGKDSDLVKKSGQKPVAYDDIAKWAQYADEADVQAITKDNIKQDVLISGKQLSEHYYVVVESIRKKANELAFKTMYFEKGSLKNSEAFKDAQTLLRGYEPDANSFAPLKD